MSDSKVSDEQAASVAVAAKLKAAMAYRNARRYESALRSIDEALSIQPNSELAWLTKGVVLAELGQCNESLSCYDKLIALDAGSAVAYRLKGATFEMQGSFGKAADCFLKAIELEPSNMGLRLNLANSYKKQKKYEDALKCYQQMLEREPKNPTINYLIGIALGDIGKYEEALTFFDDALRLKPDYNDATLAKGFVLTKLGRKDKAKACTEKLLDTKKEVASPKDANAASLNDSCRQDYEASHEKVQRRFFPTEIMAQTSACGSYSIFADTHTNIGPITFMVFLFERRYLLTASSISMFTSVKLRIIFASTSTSFSPFAAACSIS